MLPTAGGALLPLGGVEETAGTSTTHDARRTLAMLRNVLFYIPPLTMISVSRNFETDCLTASHAATAQRPAP